jgi:ribonuclease HI
MTLPKSHPLHRPLRTCARRMVKKHPSPLHVLTHVFGIAPDDYETIIPFTHAPDAPRLYAIEIAASREESKEDEAANAADIRIYTDGSGTEGKAGAAAALYRKGGRTKVLGYHLGPLAKHTTYEAEAVGVLLGLELLGRERDARKATIFLDNQGVIQAVGNTHARSGQHILGHIHGKANKLAEPTRRRCKTDLTITWVSGHDGVEGNEKADVEAKKAALNDSSQMSGLPPLLEADPLLHSLAAAQQAFKAETKQQ